MQKLPQQLLIHKLSEFLEIYDVCMLNYVLRDASEMYKFVLEARVLTNTNIPLLVQKCPRLTSLIIERSFEIAEDDEFPIDEEILENTGIEYSTDTEDMEDIRLLSSLNITKLKYCDRINCIYPFARFPHLKYIEAEYVHLLEPNKIEEIKCKSLTTAREYNSTLKRVTAIYRHLLHEWELESKLGSQKLVLNTEEPELLPYVSLDFGFADLRKVKKNIKTVVQANRVLRCVSRLPIKHLALNGDNLGNADLSILSSLNLTSLKISHIASLEPFYRMPIEKLEVSSKNLFKTDLSMFRNLKILILSTVTIDMNTIADLKIHTLELSNVNASNTSSIVGLPLKKLVVSSMDITFIADLKMDLDELHLTLVNSDLPLEIALSPNLKTLVIKNPSHNLKFDFTVLQQVKKFSISDYKISMDEIAHLSTLPIIDLGLRRCCITDEMLVVLKSLDLQYCDLSGNKISGLGLSNFRHMKLRELDCPRISICQLLK